MKNLLVPRNLIYMYAPMLCLEKVEWLLGLSTTKNDGFPIQKTVNRIVKVPSIKQKKSWLMKCKALQLPFF